MIYKSTTPTREAAETWYNNLTMAEQMEVDFLADDLVRGVKDGPTRSVQFSIMDARELVFALSVHLHAHAQHPRTRNAHLADLAAVR